MAIPCQLRTEREFGGLVVSQIPFSSVRDVAMYVKYVCMLVSNEYTTLMSQNVRIRSDLLFKKAYILWKL